MVAVEPASGGSHREKPVAVDIRSGDVSIAVRFGEEVAPRVVDIARDDASPRGAEPVAPAIILEPRVAPDCREPVLVIVAVSSSARARQLSLIVVAIGDGPGRKEAVPGVVVAVQGVNAWFMALHYSVLI